MDSILFARILLGIGLLALIGAVLVALRWRCVVLREKGERYKRAEAHRRAARGGR